MSFFGNTNKIKPSVPGQRKAKTAAFKLINGVAIEQGPQIPRPKRTMLSKSARAPTTSLVATNGGISARWVNNCNQVLKFQAFYKETVNESNEENYRTRIVNIFYYLADQKIEITEVKMENSGIPQGQFLKKGKIPRGDGSGNYLTENDFQVGSTVDIYKRVLKVINCDDFTRNYYAQQGLSQAENQPAPTDAYNSSRAAMKERDTGADQTIARGKKQNPLKKFMEASLGNASPRMRVGTQSDNLSRFLQNDRNVLRFYAMWDDSDSLYGQVHKYTLNFFLATGEMEVLEINRPNEGRDHFPCFLKRSKVERNRSTTIDGAGVNGVEDEDYHGSIFLTADDLVVGQWVYIHGRPMLIHDADDSTYNALLQATGIDYRQMKVDVEEPAQSVPEVAIPPYNGFGNEEDSVENCKHLVPQPPKKDFHKAMNNAPVGSDMKTLRFNAKMVTNSELDQNKDRRFIVRFYLSDDTVEVFEPPIRNSGILGGKFMKRTKTGDQPQNFTKGSIIEFSKTPFEILGADDYTLKFLDTDGSGTLSAEELAAA